MTQIVVQELSFVLVQLPSVVAHRGASTDRPEHTIGAYELALKEGADGLECDIRLSKDGEIVCAWHGFRFDAATGACRLYAGAPPATARAVKVEGGRVLVKG